MTHHQGPTFPGIENRFPMQWFVAVAVLVSLLASSCASATSRAPRPLEIRSEGMRVVACIPLDEGESVAVEAAGVSAVRVNGQGLPKPWGISSEDAQPKFRLAPGECLAYGQNPDGYTSVSLNVELRNDWPYSFAIRSPHWGKHGTRNHSGTFCVRQSVGQTTVVTVPQQAAVVTPAICRQLLDAAEKE